MTLKSAGRLRDELGGYGRIIILMQVLSDTGRRAWEVLDVCHLISENETH
jgi:hypothetical protein